LRLMMLKQGPQAAGGPTTPGSAAAGAGAGAGGAEQAGVSLLPCVPARATAVLWVAVCWWPAVHLLCTRCIPQCPCQLANRCLRMHTAPACLPAACRGLPPGARRLGAMLGQSPLATAIGRSRAGAPTFKCLKRQNIDDS
jgi:hypothetical protein